MIKIKSKTDLEKLINCNEISPDYRQLVEIYFLQLLESLCPPELDPDQYSLEKDGFIIVLDHKNDLNDLAQAGLPQGFAHSYFGPEWCELHELPDGKNIYQIAYLMDNDYMMIYYLDQRICKNVSEMEEFFQNQWIDAAILDSEAGDFDGC